MRCWPTFQLQHCTVSSNIWIWRNVTLLRLMSIEVPWQFSRDEYHVPATDRKKPAAKRLTSEKNFNLNRIRTCYLVLESQLRYRLSYLSVVFRGMLLEFSPLLRLQPAAERNLITAFTRSDKLEVGGWWVYDVRKLICRCGQSQVSYLRDGLTDRQMDGFSALCTYQYYAPLPPSRAIVGIKWGIWPSFDANVCPIGVV